MADFTTKKFIDLAGLSTFWTKVKGHYDPQLAAKLDSEEASKTYATKESLSSGLAAKADLNAFDTLNTAFETVQTKVKTIAEGAQVNVIESVKVSGAALTVAADKSVNIDLTDYSTTEQMNSAIADAISNEVHIDFKVVSSLPAVEKAVAGTIYLIAEAGSSGNSYGEYVLVNGAFEKLGTQHVSLEGYATESYVTTALASYSTTEQMESAIAAVNNKLGDGFDATTNTVAAKIADLVKKIEEVEDKDGQPNVIEIVKVNDTPLTVDATDKSVNIVLDAYQTVEATTSLKTELEGKITTAQNAAKAADDKAAAAQTAADNAQDAAEAAQGTANTAISILDGYSGAGSVKDAIDSVTVAYQAADTAMKGDGWTNETIVGAYAAADAASTAAGNAQTTANNAVAALGEGFTSTATVAKAISDLDEAYKTADEAVKDYVNEHIVAEETSAIEGIFSTEA